MRPKVGDRVLIASRPYAADRQSSEGIVAQVLTKSSTHPRGIKVRLTSGEIGRVRTVLASWG
ncbi:MAG TPA: DUF2196 domain-containing protein [Pantanalinema sp.]